LIISLRFSLLPSQHHTGSFNISVLVLTCFTTLHQLFQHFCHFRDFLHHLTPALFNIFVFIISFPASYRIIQHPFPSCDILHHLTPDLSTSLPFFRFSSPPHTGSFNIPALLPIFFATSRRIFQHPFPSSDFLRHLTPYLSTCLPIFRFSSPPHTVSFNIPALLTYFTTLHRLCVDVFFLQNFIANRESL
jgi:hypothetical protein